MSIMTKFTDLSRKAKVAVVGGSAAESGKNYHNVMAFSEQGLIDQLKYEKFTDSEITAGIELLKADGLL